jgi:hypothetical protein
LRIGQRNKWKHVEDASDYLHPLWKDEYKPLKHRKTAKVDYKTVRVYFRQV